MRNAVFMCLVVASALLCQGAMAWAQFHDPRALESDPDLVDGPIAPSLDGLGDHHFEVTTGDPESQKFFDQGLKLTYGFNHSEALRAFKEAARIDPNNAMAYWGWALVLGPNLNLPMLPDPEIIDQAWEASRMALSLKDSVSAKERGLIEALAERYVEEQVEDRSPLDRAYADAMGELHAQYPEDDDIATLYAAALMNLNPWSYWYPDGEPRENTPALIASLESVIERSPDHAGARHYYIHAMEAQHPDKAVAAADELAPLMPGAGHMVHMPSHIYMRVGRYADSYAANSKAVEADEEYITQCRAQGIYPLGYYPHNIHFMVWSAMFEGRSADALAAARKVAEKIPADVPDEVWSVYELFRSQPYYTMVRFGMWEEILSEPKPIDRARFMIGVWHYARALAYLESDNRGRAKRELKALRKIREEIERDGYAIGFGSADTLLTIAEEVVSGEMAADRGKYDDALGHLARAVRLEDSLPYSEPPEWYFPVRHVLGAVLLEAGYPEEAEVVYWADLQRNPENGYALFGLQQSLRAQGKDEAGQAVAVRFEKAWMNADTTLTSSRY
ncbi:MAG: hypothetical protein P8Y44_11205 [Acidobacteriota bacterium]